MQINHNIHTPQRQPNFGIIKIDNGTEAIILKRLKSKEVEEFADMVAGHANKKTQITIYNLLGSDRLRGSIWVPGHNEDYSEGMFGFLRSPLTFFRKLIKKADRVEEDYNRRESIKSILEYTKE